MTTSMIRFTEEGIELSSDRLVIGGHTGIRYENKILADISKKTYLVYSGKRLGLFLVPDDLQSFIQSYDPEMQMIAWVDKDLFYVTDSYTEIIHHDFAIGSGGEIAMGLLRYSKDIPTADIYKTVASLDIFTSKEFDSITLPLGTKNKPLI